ncbi:MAG TPA: GTPase Era [Casimicrobiaceae bacterium]|jgi:GTP-binding protein Era|nr:GTPase Era [Casimicrobiaceae bacterium]
MNKRAAPDGPTASAFRCGQVAIVGKPSVGKSTLLNALVGARIAITSRRPQTTRYRLRGILTTAHAQFIFVDTPGFQTRYRSRLTERMNRSVRTSLTDVDVVVVVLEAKGIDAADREVLALLPAAVPVIAAVNKVDRLTDRGRLLPLLATIAAAHEFAAIVPVSAEKHWQLDQLTSEIATYLPPGPPLYPADELTDRDERFLAAEYLREKIFRLLGEELPYATAAQIDSFTQEGDLRRIHATILVQKASQRAILLGSDGARMKQIATAARRDMERLFGGKVFLEVWVRVKAGWADDERTLTRLGY